MKREVVPNKPLRADLISSVTVAGNVTEIKTLQKRNDRQQVRLKDRNHYIKLDTGEIKEVVHREKRTDDLQEIRRTMRDLRLIINANTAEPEKVRFLTLTYRECMTDVERLRKDFKNFNARFQRWSINNGYGKAEYINVVEPQARGAWHCHLLYIWKELENAPYIPRATLEKIWENGFVHVRAINDVDNVGAYLTAYLADIEVPSGAESLKTNVVEKRVEGRSKRFIKGGRLSLYPANMRIFRVSSGIIRPEPVNMPYGDAMKLVAGLECVYKRTVHISDANSGFENTICTEQYNTMRKAIFNLTPVFARIDGFNYLAEISEEEFLSLMPSDEEI